METNDCIFHASNRWGLEVEVYYTMITSEPIPVIRVSSSTGNIELSRAQTKTLSAMLTAALFTCEEKQ